MRKEPVEVRLARGLEQRGECLVWVKGCNHDGYGSIGVAPKRCEATHRVYWRLYRGEIPPGMMVLHRCPNRDRRCATHTYLGTQKDNMQDAARDGMFPGRGFFFDWSGKKRHGRNGKLVR